MNVYFDYQIFCLQKYGGISRYFLELAAELHQLEHVRAKILAPYANNLYLEADKDKSYVFSFSPLLQKLLHNRFINKETASNEWAAKFFTGNKKNTILHETYYTQRVQVKCPKVITIHDMIYELYNSGLEDEKIVMAAKAKAIREADRIIAVSENTKKDLVTFYPEAKTKTAVVYHGVRPFQSNTVSAFKHPKPFFLYVGNRGWYKNFKFLVEVYASDKSICSTCDILCFGGGSFSEEENLFLQQLGVQSNVKYISGTDDVLTTLYKSALALVYISNYEGFGMPVLEAMALNCPVIAANTSSLPEVCGDAAVMVNPQNANEITKALSAMATDANLRAHYSKLGKQRAADFSWKKCAEETLRVYQTLIRV